MFGLSYMYLGITAETAAIIISLPVEDWRKRTIDELFKKLNRTLLSH